MEATTKSGGFLTKSCGPALDPLPPIQFVVRTIQNYHYFFFDVVHHQRYFELKIKNQTQLNKHKHKNTHTRNLLIYSATAN